MKRSYIKPMNEVTLIGTLGKDAKEYKGGKGSIARFTMVTSTSWKNKKTGEYEEETQWHNIICFNDFFTPKIIDNGFTGAVVMVRGTLKYRTWTDSEGNEKPVTEIVIPKFGGDFNVLQQGKMTEPDDGSEAEAKQEEEKKQDFDDDIPF